MAIQLMIGIGMIGVTAYVHAWALALATKELKPITRWAKQRPTHFRLSTALSASVVGVMAAHLVEVALWAVGFLALGVFADMETSFYFTLVAYTTLGFGDIILPDQRRILSGFVAANGFLIFGWSTAYQVDFLADLRKGF
ncbi:MAG: ion channel [Alphaproteobacteria bacterium]